MWKFKGAWHKDMKKWNELIIKRVGGENEASNGKRMDNVKIIEYRM